VVRKSSEGCFWDKNGERGKRLPEKQYKKKRRHEPWIIRRKKKKHRRRATEKKISQERPI